ncbi:MAG: IS630 family transposase [Bryobacteraceae bacterium]|nr:IS630 family transposase [Bryobacteraceae bacterium]
MGDAARPGKPAQYDQTTEQRVLALLDERPPKGYSQWNGSRVAEQLGDVSKDQVWRILRRHHICLQRRRSWCISTDPEFGPKAADAVGLYLNPPREALILSVDEKPSIQALGTSARLPAVAGRQGGQWFQPRLQTARDDDPVRRSRHHHRDGQDRPLLYQRRRRREFLDLMNEVVADHPGREIHVVLDNLNTHKPKDGRWLKKHPNVHFHFTPTYSSWLNQVECWFSILSRQALLGASFTSPQQLRQAIDDFVAAYNPKAAPFEWKKAVVFPSSPKRKYFDLCN